MSAIRAILRAFKTAFSSEINYVSVLRRARSFYAPYVYASLAICVRVGPRFFEYNFGFPGIVRKIIATNDHSPGCNRLDFRVNVVNINKLFFADT